MSRDDELVTAYVDGVGELAADERRRIEALLEDDPAARAEAEATRELLNALRALPAEGNEPARGALEHRIRAAVAEVERRPWWRRARWLVPIGALAATAAGALVWLALGRTRAPVPRAAELAPAPTPAPAAAPAPTPTPGPELVWLGDQAIDVEGLDADAILGDLDHDARAALAADSTDVTGGILPAVDLGWIDHLDDAQLDRAENWLASQTPHAGEADHAPEHGKNG